jgi:hypothetical protein
LSLPFLPLQDAVKERINREKEEELALEKRLEEVRYSKRHPVALVHMRAHTYIHIYIRTHAYIYIYT